MIQNLLRKICTYFYDALVIHIEDEKSEDDVFSIMDKNVNEAQSIINSKIHLF